MTVSTPPVVDIAALTAPISADQPAGVHLREDFSPESLYYALKGAAREARATERKRDEGEPVEPDWGPICALGQQALESSKDMEVCCWVIEGLCREAGFAGLRDGFDIGHAHRGFDQRGHRERFQALGGLDLAQQRGLVPALGDASH